MSRRRTPSDEEIELWEQVAETVAPLKPRAPRDKRDAAPPKPAPLLRPRTTEAPVLVKPPPLAPMDRRNKSRVARGAVGIDRRVDLHGLTQAAAERELGHFLQAAQEDGARIVLVITGKGKSGEERGVLKRMVPMWLSAARWRHLVVGFEEAAPNHGGSGALYVRIRRAR
ncbi:MAG TPA: Smr/MutS family protein [Bauldia sp.]|nr:Smr/MutS family protein [Bauldia sp.]